LNREVREERQENPKKLHVLRGPGGSFFETYPATIQEQDFSSATHLRNDRPQPN
jgi:hypothetical protein